MFYIGVMTGNSMDAVDVALAQTDGVRFLKLAAFRSYPFERDMQQQMAALRQGLNACCTRAEIESLPDFWCVHNAFITKTAQCIADFMTENQIDADMLSGVCFHGKTLDHCPPSRKTDLVNGRKTPYTVQLGSGQMLADEIYRRLPDKKAPVRVIYDFRSDDIFAGGEGAPLIPVLNAFMARQAGVLNRLDINAGNTSNVCIVKNGEPVGGWDLGPCNEYPDYLVRRHKGLAFDKGGVIGAAGQVDYDLLQVLFDAGRPFYEKMPPKSGDPAIYGTGQIAAFQTGACLSDKVCTSVYFSAYVAALGLRHITGQMPNDFLLFGGGWKNPLLYRFFVELLTTNAPVLPEHESAFAELRNRFQTPRFVIDENAQAIESLLMALMGAYYDLKKPWTTPLLTGCLKPAVLGREALSAPVLGTVGYVDALSRACF